LHIATEYELHEYFAEFQIEIVACPDLTREPYNLLKSGKKYNSIILMLSYLKYNGLTF